MLNGTVPAGGADWHTIQADGFTELDTRYMIKTDKGDLVYVQNGGIRTVAPDVSAEAARRPDRRSKARVPSELNRNSKLPYPTYSGCEEFVPWSW
jgi:hypothetical protein